MFAILISTENLPLINQAMDHYEDFKKEILDLYLQSEKDWYVITGYVSSSERFHPWSIQPKYILETFFEYDADKIQTEWDQIVRK